jgi:septum formation protein
VVVRDGVILGKPASEDDAVAMLLSLAGRGHDVVSGVALLAPGPMEPQVRVVRTRVVFRDFDAATAAAYVATGEPMDKAGAYAIQGRGAALVTRVEGDYHAVVGLPVAALVDVLARVGRPYRFGR